MKRMKQAFDDDERRLSLSPSPSPARLLPTSSPSPRAFPSPAASPTAFPSTIQKYSPTPTYEVTSSNGSSSHSRSPSVGSDASLSTVSARSSYAVDTDPKFLHIIHRDGGYRIVQMDTPPPSQNIYSPTIPSSSSKSSPSQLSSCSKSEGESFEQFCHRALNRAHLSGARADALTNLVRSLRSASVAVNITPEAGEAAKQRLLNKLAQAEAGISPTSSSTHGDPLPPAPACAVSSHSSAASDSSRSSIGATSLSQTSASASSPSLSTSTTTSSATHTPNNGHHGRRSRERERPIPDTSRAPARSSSASSTNSHHDTPGVSTLSTRSSLPRSRSRSSTADVSFDALSQWNQSKVEHQTTASAGSHSKSPGSTSGPSMAQTSASEVNCSTTTNTHLSSSPSLPRCPPSPSSAPSSKFQANEASTFHHPDTNIADQDLLRSAPAETVTRTHTTSTITTTVPCDSAGGLTFATSSLDERHGPPAPSAGRLTTPGGGLGLAAPGGLNNVGLAASGISIDQLRLALLAGQSEIPEDLLNALVSQAAGVQDTAYLSKSLDLQRQLEVQKKELILKETAFLKERYERMLLEEKLEKQKEALERLTRGRGS